MPRLYLVLAALMMVVVYSHVIAWQKIDAAQHDRISTPPVVDINGD